MDLLGTFSIRVGRELPYGTRILYATAGITNSGTTTITTNAGSFISLEIYENISNRIDPPIAPSGITIGGSLAGSIVDVYNIDPTSTGYSPGSSQAQLTNAGQITNLTSTTVFLNIDLSTSPVYIGRENEYIVLLRFASVKTLSSGDPTSLFVSPIVMRYVWT